MYIWIPKVTKKEIYYENLSKYMQMNISYDRYSDLPGSCSLHFISVKGKRWAQVNVLNLEILTHDCQWNKSA